MADLNQLFHAAEAAFAQGRTAEARRALDQVEKLVGAHAAVLHLRALVEQQGGNSNGALTAFAQARRLAPNDPQIANNYGNLLDALGRGDEALAAHDAAVRLVPRDAESRINRGITLHRLGRLGQARADFLTALELRPATVRALIGLAGVERQAGDLDRAADLYDQALARAPDHVIALHGRAVVSAGRGEPNASARYERLAALVPEDTEARMGLIEALDAQGDPAGRKMLAEMLRVRPEWVDGHRALSRMRADAGEDIFEALDQAVVARPGDRGLRRLLWRTLVHAERYDDALAAIEQTRADVGVDRDLILEEAAVASEAGQTERAAALLRQLDESDDVRLVRGRLALRCGEPAAAAADLEQVVEREPGAINAWAHLGTAWRLTGDARADWLYAQPGLVSTHAISLSAAELAQLAEVLRTIHRARADPLGQSLRGGTQTRGRLLARTEPEIRALAARLREAVAAHVADLPPADPRHPLLRHRNAAFRFDGSWSVRLTDGGRHVPHIHNEGLLSSACYIALPQQPGADPQAGWLELGRPPAELGLDLPPLTVIEPVPGRLALFPSYLHHGTRPFATGERLTVAFDLIPA